MIELNKIKFPVANKPEFIQELRKKVKAYFETNKISEYGNSSLIVKTIVMMLLYFIPFACMLSGIITSLPLMFTCWILMGVGAAGIGMGCMHDANHRSFSKNQRINKYMGSSLYLLGGFPLIWQHQHNVLHHGYTNIEGHDEDISPGGILRFSPHQRFYKVHRLQHFYAWFFYSIMTLSWITIKEFRQLHRYQKTNVELGTKKSYKRLYIELILAKVLYYLFTLVLPLVILPFGWVSIVLGFVAMHVVCGLLLTTIFQTAHIVPSSEFPLPDNTGSMKNNWAIHQLLTTSDFAPKSRLFSWFLGGLNFQVVHHLFPNVSHVHYRAIAKLVRETAEKYRLPYHVQSSFYKAVRNHVILLKQLGRKSAMA
jgi:linoleoyl-CoA desaturase